MAKVGICEYGWNYFQMTPDTIIGGFLLSEWTPLTQARKKNLRAHPESIVRKANLEQFLKHVNYISSGIESEINIDKEKYIKDYLERELYKPDFLEPLKRNIMEGLSFVHDYKQINAQIAQNINVVIMNNIAYTGATIDEKLDKATAEEKAIYWSSKLLEEKLNVAKLLVNPYYMNNQPDFASFRFHGLFMKYRRIYTPIIERKGIKLNLSGSSHNEIYAHPQAVSVIPHSLLDNAIKYAPRDSTIDVIIDDIQDGIFFSVCSLGPRILPEESEKIFFPFFRGEAAIHQEEEGAGYGLYVSQLVAIQHLDSKITCHQDLDEKMPLMYSTRFSIKFPLKAKYVR
jgi:signal transduction histidine kinase